jgi:Uma2 family endonuclease
MTARKDRKALYAELEALPEHLNGEIVNGELVVSPRPASPHAYVTSILGAELVPPFHRGRGGPGGWVILDEPELHLGDDVLIPDLAGWRRERMPQVPNVANFTLAPDWVCEVLSKSTVRVDLEGKLPIYARAGVKHAWIVDPLLRTLHVYRAEHERWVLASVHAGETRIRAEPFDAIELELGALWLPENEPAR